MNDNEKPLTKSSKETTELERQIICAAAYLKAVDFRVLGKVEYMDYEPVIVLAL